MQLQMIDYSNVTAYTIWLTAFKSERSLLLRLGFNAQNILIYFSNWMTYVDKGFLIV